VIIIARFIRIVVATESVDFSVNRCGSERCFALRHPGFLTHESSTNLLADSFEITVCTAALTGNIPVTTGILKQEPLRRQFRVSVAISS
jgi:hypothetical protein